MDRSKLFLYALVSVISIVLFAFVAVQQTYVLTSPLTTFSEEDIRSEAFWEDRIASVGYEQAYQEFVTLIDEFPDIREQHIYAHIFGGALYDAMGIPGFPACGSEFQYGCFHEFIGRAIAKDGIDSAFSLNQSCTDTLGKDSLFCQHGIGHGVQSFFGYDTSDLYEALDVCRDLPDNDPVGGCYGGVFMEYNMQTMLGEDAQIRESTNVFAPCNAVADTYVPACIFWHVQWWSEGLLKEEADQKRYASMGDLCREFAEVYSGAVHNIRRTCFAGIGNITSLERDSSAANISRLCDSAARTEGERVECYATAIAGFPQGLDEREVRGGLCKKFDGVSRAYCTAFVDKKEGERIPDISALFE